MPWVSHAARSIAERAETAGPRRLDWLVSEQVVRAHLEDPAHRVHCIPARLDGTAFDYTGASFGGTLTHEGGVFDGFLCNVPEKAASEDDDRGSDEEIDNHGESDRPWPLKSCAGFSFHSECSARQRGARLTSTISAISVRAQSPLAASLRLRSMRSMFSHSGSSLLTAGGVADSLSRTIPIGIVTPSLALILGGPSRKNRGARNPAGVRRRPEGM